MNKRKDLITMKGNPLTLLGTELKVGDKAPGFTVVKNDMTKYNFTEEIGKKIFIISSVPSLDTSVCDIETKKFNQILSNLSSDISILTISMDLPFAQSRWCGASGVDKVITLSDHMDASFGTSYGVLIEELRLLARCLYIIDKSGIIRDIHLVKEVTNEPDYDKVIENAKKLI